MVVSIAESSFAAAFSVGKVMNIMIVRITIASVLTFFFAYLLKKDCHDSMGIIRVASKTINKQEKLGKIPSAIKPRRTVNVQRPTCLGFFIQHYLVLNDL